ncbi:carbon starvation CstA family protein [uncultured Mailhella sp.]|uniref:carbon starvation CstA family protein n=1 Tax=uncultured Mailhella sp. TaxID=1981031 RepID=UPI00260BA0AF|nr:carbon starvation CstA family protein [uncultured Mailhella sp.]
MVSFFLCLALLIIGYFTYGKLVENTFGPDDRETPAVVINDGVDYVVLPQWKLFLIQLLNIAGLGPIFGALQGALWGPVVFLWITFGTIFAGAVHDFFSGMTSERNNGASVSEITGIYLGDTMKTVMRVFSVVLLVMVGTVFAVGPAGLIVKLCSEAGASGVLLNASFWLTVVLVYYFIATFISIDKIIGKIYPLFGICLIIMAVGVGAGLVTNSSFQIPEIWDHFANMHPKGTPIWAFMFITVACGAISGFHATQSPLMARCMKSEHQGHFVFYGAMVCEGIIALIWAAAGCSIYEITNGQTTGLLASLGSGQSAAIYDVCSKTMGGIGIALAMIGVIACPITSGDTAFRSARLVLSDWFKMPQTSYKNRLIFCVPLLGAGALISQLDYSIVWRYFSWTNQTLAMIVLWAASMYLFLNKKNYWITAVPAAFMSAVSITYFCMAPECLGLIVKLPVAVAYVLGIAAAALFLCLFLRATKKRA